MSRVGVWIKSGSVKSGSDQRMLLRFNHFDLEQGVPLIQPVDLGAYPGSVVAGDRNLRRTRVFARRAATGELAGSVHRDHMR